MNWDQMQVGRQVCKPGMPETAHFDIMPFGLFLLIRYETPSKSTALDITHAHAQFRTLMIGKHIVFLSRFGMMPWVRSFFHVAEAQKKVVPHPAGGNGLTIHIILVDANTGKVVARRVAAITPEVTQKLVSLMAIQDPEDKLLIKDIERHKIKNRYTTQQLAVLANLRHKI